MSKKIKILLAEDDINLGTILKEFIEIKNFEVELTKDGESAFLAYKQNGFDLCIFDVMMPIKDGFTLAKEIRKLDKEIPFVFLTAKSLQEDRIEGLKIGADDYITKPFSTEELMLRINAILRRIKVESNNGKKKYVQIGAYKFSADTRELVLDDRSTKLTSKESQLLKLLSDAKFEIIDRSFALKQVWGEDNYFTGRSMDVYIAKLRKHLSDDSSIEIINVHGKGFKLIE